MREHLPGKTRALSVLRRPSSNSRCSPPRHTRSWRPRHGVSSSAESLTLANTSFAATNAGGREHWSAAPPARAGHLLSLFRPALMPLVSSTLRLVPLWTLTDFCAWSPSSFGSPRPAVVAPCGPQFHISFSSRCPQSPSPPPGVRAKISAPLWIPLFPSPLTSWIHCFSRPPLTSLRARPTAHL